MVTWDSNIQIALDKNSAPIQREVWRELLFQRFRDRPLPLLVSDLGTIPAASIWTGSRIWLSAFRELGLQAGDRVIVALPPSPAFLQVLVAGIWQELSLAFVSDSVMVDQLIQQVDARCVIALKGNKHTLIPNGVAGPAYPAPQLRSAIAPPSPDVRFLLQTSGTTRSPRWVALSDRNILSVLSSHSQELALHEARILSVLPWHHAFGLIIELLTAIFSGGEIIRDPEGGRNLGSILSLAKNWEVTHFSSVPLTIKRLIETEEGRSFLQSLKGGVVGGAPLSQNIASFLEGTKLRAGYGQTEASPGIALGKPGVWRPNFLGHPLGCEVKIGEDGQLWFKGPNACYGMWQDGALEILDPNRWVATGDRVVKDENGLIYRGRLNDRFKLDNGRMVEAGTIESILKETIANIEDALLFSEDGAKLKLLVRTLNEQQVIKEDIEACLGSISKLLDDISLVPDEFWVRTRKGDIARDATVQALTSNL